MLVGPAGCWLLANLSYPYPIDQSLSRDCVVEPYYLILFYRPSFPSFGTVLYFPAPYEPSKNSKIK